MAAARPHLYYCGSRRALQFFRLNGAPAGRLAFAVFELDGASGDRPSAYEAAALLLAIWDDEMAADTGGTGQVIRRANADHILVVWIEPISKADNFRRMIRMNHRTM
jgi:hypothetical protein